MTNQGIQRIFGQSQRARQWLTRSGARRRPERRALKRKAELRWWLVYGPPRSGTSYMLQLIRTCSVLFVSDWGLAPILNPVPNWLKIRSAPDFAYIRFDYERFLRDISNNILDSAYGGHGIQLDLVDKQATLDPREYQALVKMWGVPARTIFCLREPAGYIASAVNKFVYDSVEHLQQVYIDSVDSYLQIKGDVFEYTPDLTISDYTSFLRPLDFRGKRLVPFRHNGVQEHEQATEDMWSAYHRVKKLATAESRP